ncbi:hypothetical protein SAMN04488238_109165 [Roseicitreum antarcticum]|uniref:Uncharacterized protein n=1 Tax=Roseicitreum antarcticum TaxID=564137 RepID=A0A1H3CI38_9RHOB|nr:hypothetical protein SAMN04488238_109165 [Roseicitreum antarcticum]
MLSQASFLALSVPAAAAEPALNGLRPGCNVSTDPGNGIATCKSCHADGDEDDCSHCFYSSDHQTSGWKPNQSPYIGSLSGNFKYDAWAMRDTGLCHSGIT